MGAMGNIMKTNEVEVVAHDVLIFGTGLAGLRAAVEIARASKDSINMALVSKVQIQRPHSVCAEGGSAAVLRPEEGDNLDLHAWDTVKGADFLADQDVVSRFVELAPKELLLLEHWGIPWSRRPDGRIMQRPFGGHSFPRCTMAQDKTGFFEVQTLYDTLMQYRNFARYDEFFATSILSKNGEFAGITGIDMATGKFMVPKRKGHAYRHRGARHALRIHHLLSNREWRWSGHSLPGRNKHRGSRISAVSSDRPYSLRHSYDRSMSG